MTMSGLQAALHQLPEDHPSVIRATVLARLQGAVGASEIRNCISDLERLLQVMEAPTRA